MTSVKIKTLVPLAALVLGFSVFFLYRVYFQERAIATVGDYTITEKDKLLRDQIQGIFYPQDPNSYGLNQLVTAFTYAQILKNNGHEITDHILRAEEMRINQNTKAPEVLKKIHDLFKGDDEAFKKVFVLPTYAERTIHSDFFNKSPKAHEKSLKKVREIQEQIAESKGSFRDIAKESDLTYKRLTISKEAGLEWETENAKDKAPKSNGNEAGLINITTQAPAEIRQHIDQEFHEKSMESVQFWIDNILMNLLVGETLQSPVDFENFWLIVKYLKPLSRSKFQLEAIFVPKDSYQNWLAAETAKIHIKR